MVSETSGNMGELYEDGRGVETDINQARQLTQRAAQSGHRIAMHDLALYYMDGRGGVNIDVNSAQQWFEQAAQHGVVDSQFNLAVLAESQKTPLRNLETAYFWYSIAAAQGDDAAKTRISAIAQNLSAEQISAAQSRIAAFKPKPIIAEVNGVFKDLPWDKASNAQKSAQLNSNTQNSGQAAQSVQIDNIRHVQKQLAALGYDIGQPDGAIGPRTLAAIKAFQKANNLPETGQINAELQGQLTNIAGI